MGKKTGGLILAVNSGSSSLKFGLFAEDGEDEKSVLAGGTDGVGTSSGKLRVADANGKVLVDESYALPSQGKALEKILAGIGKSGHAAPIAVGHRVVHGGPHLREHQQITDKLIETLQAAVHFAPLHIPASLALIKVTQQLLPDVPQFACFDTAFHATMPESSYHFALPEELEREGLRRYGFHGLSYESVVHRLGPKVPARVVCAHLGSGASLVALRDGKSVDTSMGMTPTGGIPMATRSGDLDPGILIFLMRNKRLGADDLEKMLNHQSGLEALSGGETDMRQLLSKANKGDSKAALAIDIFCSAVRKTIGAYAAELGGLNLLVFTGGIGEHSAEIRERICDGLEFLGVQADRMAVMKSEEELQIARHCRRLMRNN